MMRENFDGGNSCMKATEIVAELPEQATEERAKKIINFIGMGHLIPPKLVEIEWGWNNHTARMRVMSDALMIGEPDDFLRINASMEDEQIIAEILGLSMITSKIADVIRLAAVQIEPCIQTADASMACTSRMVRHSKEVTERIQKVTGASVVDIANGVVGCVSDVGKDWVLSNLLFGRQDLAANNGWHTKTKPDPKNPKNGPYACPGGGYMWQPLSTRHNRKHVDYSQVVRLMAFDMVVDGQEMCFKDVGSDPQLCGLVSYEGPLKFFC